MSALPAQTSAVEQSSAATLSDRYPLRLRATIVIGSAAGLWGLIGLAGWAIYRVVA